MLNVKLSKPIFRLLKMHAYKDGVMVRTFSQVIEDWHHDSLELARLRKSEGEVKNMITKLLKKEPRLKKMETEQNTQQLEATNKLIEEKAKELKEMIAATRKDLHNQLAKLDQLERAATTNTQTLTKLTIPQQNEELKAEIETLKQRPQLNAESTKALDKVADFWLSTGDIKSKDLNEVIKLLCNEVLRFQ